MDEQLSLLQRSTDGFTFERLSAVPAANVKHDANFSEFRARGLSTVAYPSMSVAPWPTAACQYSHETIIEQVAARSKDMESSNELWLILEDDAIVPADLQDRWNRMWPFVPEDWDIVRLGWFGSHCSNFRINKFWDVAQWSDPPPSGPCYYCGVQGYMVNPARADRILERLRRSKVYLIDALLGAPTPPGENETEVPRLAVFAAQPKLIKQNESFHSDRIVETTRALPKVTIPHFEIL